MGVGKNPAGIVYLDLTFHEPKGCRLQSATVKVTLDDDDPELMDFLSPAQFDASYSYPVQMTDSYGPRGFVGTEKVVQKKKATNVNPNIQVGGFGGSLGDHSRESNSTSSSRWAFQGHLIPSESVRWKYSSLQWELTENDFEAQSSHSNVVHTAFAFQHARAPFFMKIEVDGKLRGSRDQMKQKFSRFRASTKNEGAAVTLIQFRHYHDFAKPLDARARALPFEMEQANCEAIPVQVMDPQPVTFHNVTGSDTLGSEVIPSAWKVPCSCGASHDTSPPNINLGSQGALASSTERSSQSREIEHVQSSHRKTSEATLEGLAEIMRADLSPIEPKVPRRRNRDRTFGASTSSGQEPKEERDTQIDTASNPASIQGILPHMRGLLAIFNLLLFIRDLLLRSTTKAS